MSDVPSSWPSLDGFATTGGHAATHADVAAGRAVFVMQSEGQPVGVPSDIPLPQYGFYYEDGKPGRRIPCVVIQAEEYGEQRLIGCLTLPDREMAAGLINDFDLLGQSVPLTH